MAVTTYEEEVLTEEQVGAAKDFLPENTVVKILFHKGKPIGVELPIAIKPHAGRGEGGLSGPDSSLEG